MSTGLSYEALTLSCQLVYHMKLSHCHVDWNQCKIAHISVGNSYRKYPNVLTIIRIKKKLLPYKVRTKLGVHQNYFHGQVRTNV